MRRLVEKLLPGGRIGRGIAILAGGTVGGQAIVLLASPLLTRLYAPEDFGVLGVFSAILYLIGFAVCLRYELAIPLADNDATMVNLMAVAGLAALLVSTLTGFVLLAFGRPLMDWLDAPSLLPWLWLLPPSLLAMGAFNILNHWAIRRQAFGRITRTKLAQGIGQALVPAVVALGISGPFGLLAGQIVGQVAGFGTHARAFLRQERSLLQMVGMRPMCAAAALYGRLAAYGASGALLSGGSRLLPALLVAALHGMTVAGLFVLTQRVVAAPARLLGAAVAQVYLSEAPRLAREDRSAMVRLFSRTTWRLVALAGAILAVLLVTGPPLFGLVFGAVWTEAGNYARLLAPMYLAQLVVSPISQTLTVINRMDLLLFWEAGRLAAVLLVFAAAAKLAWPPLLTLGCLSAAGTLAYAILFLVILRMLRAPQSRPV